MTIRFEKKNYITTLTEKQQKTSAWSSGKIDKYEYLTGEEILPSNQRQIIEQAKFTSSPLGKTLKKETKIIEDQGKKNIKAIEDHGKQLVESNDLIKKDFNIDINRRKHKEQKNIFNKLHE